MGRYKKHFRKGTGAGNKIVSDEDIIKYALLDMDSVQISREVGIAPCNVRKRLRRLSVAIAKAKVIKDGGLTKEEGEFCEKLVSGSGYAAAMYKVNPNISPESARVEGKALFDSRQDIKKVIRELMEIKGMGLEKRVEKLKEHALDSKDPMVSLKALDMSFKLDGSMVSEHHTEQTINVGIMDLSAYATKVVEVKQ